MTNGRNKGATAERKLAKLFAAWWGSDFARTPLSGGFATAKFREDWNACGDLVTPDKSFPFCVESKKVEGWTLEQMLTSNKTLIHKWWEQVVNETPPGKIPMLVFTKNHAPLYVMMATEHAVAAAEPDMMFFWTFVSDKYERKRKVMIFAFDFLLKSKKESWLYDR